MSLNTATAAGPAPAADPALVGATIDTYLATWNETDAPRRQAAIARAWAADGLYRDPLMASEGHAGIDAMVAAVQARFPGFVMKRTSGVDAHNGSARFAWSLGPAAGPTVVEGVDFCSVAPDGRLASVVGVIDKMPG